MPVHGLTASHRGGGHLAYSQSTSCNNKTLSSMSLLLSDVSLSARALRTRVARVCARCVRARVERARARVALNQDAITGRDARRQCAACRSYKLPFIPLHQTYAFL